MALTLVVSLDMTARDEQEGNIYKYDDCREAGCQMEALMSEQDSIAIADSLRNRTFWQKFLAYFNDANKNKKNKKFDFSVIGGPHYSTTTKLGIGLVAAGLYKTDRSDSLLKVSNVSLFGDVSTSGFYMLGVKGTNIFPRDLFRLDYTLFFFSFPSNYWGMGYDLCNDDDNESDLDRWQTRMKTSFLIRIADNFYAGPMVTFDYIKASDVERPELLEGMKKEEWHFGIGANIVYDSRDVLTNPHRGVYFNLCEYVRPKAWGNVGTITTTDLELSGYKTVWKGGIIAGNLKSQLNFGDPTWATMAQFTMRGYYEGRYRDKHKIEAQVELRQHVWRRMGLTGWIGAGTVFHKFSQMDADEILPNFGVGYRWEFKKDVNVRLDLGFGKSGQTGFMFNINEAF